MMKKKPKIKLLFTLVYFRIWSFCLFLDGLWAFRAVVGVAGSCAQASSSCGSLQLAPCAQLGLRPGKKKGATYMPNILYYSMGAFTRSCSPKNGQENGSHENGWITCSRESRWLWPCGSALRFSWGLRVLVLLPIFWRAAPSERTPLLPLGICSGSRSLQPDS